MRKVFLLLLALAGLLGATPVGAADDCPFTAVRDGCLYTNTGSDTADPFDGFAVTNAGGIPFWDFYRSLSPQDVGYPISRRFQLDGFWVQAFQKVVLQWQPATGTFNYLNTLDLLADRHPGVELPFLPAHEVLPLPAFAIWRVEAPGVEIGRVVRQNIPDEVKKLTGVLIPESAKIPSRQPTVDEVLAACPSAADIALVDADLDLQFEADPSAGALVCPAAAGSADLTFVQERT